MIWKQAHLYGDRHTIESAPDDNDYLSETWQTFLADLKDVKDKSYLPIVNTEQATIYTTEDGKLTPLSRRL